MYVAALSQLVLKRLMGHNNKYIPYNSSNSHLTATEVRGDYPNSQHPLAVQKVRQLLIRTVDGESSFLVCPPLIKVPAWYDPDIPVAVQLLV